MTQREEKRQPRKDIRLAKYMAPLALPTAAVSGPMARATRICARKYWQLSREMSTPIPRRVPSACEPTNCEGHTMRGLAVLWEPLFPPWPRPHLMALVVVAQQGVGQRAERGEEDAISSTQ